MRGKQEAIVHEHQPSSSSSSYKYSPLEKNHIRLVKILPSTPGSSVNCTIHHASLDVGQGKPPRYIALSYVWGDTANAPNIQLNGCSFRVTQNLYGVLSVLGHGDAELRRHYFWIDAVCIDQKNATEKAKQVGRMSEIYTTADDVICWLSPGTCTERNRRLFERCKTCELIKFLHHLGSGSSPDQSPNLLLDSLKDEFLRAVHSQWFTRVWTLQECTINQRGTIQIGELHRIPINLFLNGCFKAWVYWGLPRHLPVYQTLKHMVSIRNRRTSLDLRTSSRNVYAETIIMLLKASSNRDCSVPQDKLYGVFGLLNSMHHAPDRIRPNYEKTFERVCHDSAIEIFTNSPTYSMKFLAFERNELQGDVPSWVPDFRYIGNIDLSQQVRDGTARLSSNNRQLVFDASYTGACVYSLGAMVEFEHQDLDSPARDRLIERIDEFERDILFPAAAYASIDPGELIVEWLSLQLSGSPYIDDCLLTWLTLAHWIPATANQELQRGSSAELQAESSSTTVSEPVH